MRQKAEKPVRKFAQRDFDLVRYVSQNSNEVMGNVDKEKKSRRQRPNTLNDGNPGRRRTRQILDRHCLLLIKTNKSKVIYCVFIQKQIVKFSFLFFLFTWLISLHVIHHEFQFPSVFDHVYSRHNMNEVVNHFHYYDWWSRH